MRLISIIVNLHLILLHIAPEAVTGLQYQLRYLDDPFVDIIFQWMVS